MATSKTDKASKTAAKKGGRKTAREQPPDGRGTLYRHGQECYPAQARKGRAGRFWRKEGQVNGRTRRELLTHCIAADTDAAVTA